MFTICEIIKANIQLSLRKWRMNYWIRIISFVESTCSTFKFQLNWITTDYFMVNSNMKKQNKRKIMPSLELIIDF
jgi:hypothetical protein